MDGAWFKRLSEEMRKNRPATAEQEQESGWTNHPVFKRKRRPVQQYETTEETSPPSKVTPDTELSVASMVGENSSTTTTDHECTDVPEQSSAHGTDVKNDEKSIEDEEFKYARPVYLSSSFFADGHTLPPLVARKMRARFGTGRLEGTEAPQPPASPSNEPKSTEVERVERAVLNSKVTNDQPEEGPAPAPAVAEPERLQEDEPQVRTDDVTTAPTQAAQPLRRSVRVQIKRERAAKENEAP